MRTIIKTFILIFDDSIFRLIVKWVYPKYQRPRKGYVYNFDILRRYFFMQKVIGVNRAVPWPVDFRSKILGYEYIKKGVMCDPGDNIGIYINAYGGLILGDNVNIGQNTVITTTNHDIYDHRKISNKNVGVTIGNNVWIGANCSIVAGVKIGNNVTIGAGCVIRKNVPSNTLVIHKENQLKLIKKRNYNWDYKKEILN